MTDTDSANLNLNGDTAKVMQQLANAQMTPSLSG